MSQQLLDALQRIGPRRVLVVGDLALDEYWVGRATRLSREAPIPVLEHVHEFTVPGGAGNPAHNLVALGANAIPVGVIGQDRSGERLLAKFRELRIDVAGIVTDPSRPTTTKLRIMAEGSMPTFPQHTARIDRVDRRPLDPPVERALADRIAQVAEQSDALIVSDYRSGLVTPHVVETCLRVARDRRLLLTVDSQGSLLRFRQFDLVRANREETELTLGRRLVAESDYQGACAELLQRLEARVVVITRAGDGLSLATREGRYAHVPAVNRSEVFDVTGAGDTVIAVLTLAMACGVDPIAAAGLAACAAGIVVKHIGVAVTTVDQLRAEIQAGTP
jgi:rfaE bifunctional protein kinase chain/domain